MADYRGINARAMGRMVSGQDMGAPVFILHFNSSTSSGTTNTDTVVENANFPFRVLRAWISMTEAAATDSEDVKLTDGTNDITDTMDYSNGADNDNYEFSQYDNAYSTISKGGDLKIVKTASTAVTSFDMFILCARVVS